MFLLSILNPVLEINFRMSLFELGKALLCSTCFIYGLSILSIDLSILPGLSNSNNEPRSPLNCTILDN